MFECCFVKSAEKSQTDNNYLYFLTSVCFLQRFKCDTPPPAAAEISFPSSHHSAAFLPLVIIIMFLNHKYLFPVSLFPFAPFSQLVAPLTETQAWPKPMASLGGTNPGS